MWDSCRVGWGWELMGVGGLHAILFKNPPKCEKKMVQKILPQCRLKQYNLD